MDIKVKEKEIPAMDDKKSTVFYTFMDSDGAQITKEVIRTIVKKEIKNVDPEMPYNIPHNSQTQSNKHVLNKEKVATRRIFT